MSIVCKYLWGSGTGKDPLDYCYFSLEVERLDDALVYTGNGLGSMKYYENNQEVTDYMWQKYEEYGAYIE